MRKAQNWPNLLILVILDGKKPNLVKIGNFKWSINPLGHSAQLRGRQNHVVLQTLYLKNRKESDMKIESFFEEEEISYNISKIWLSTAIFAARKSFWSLTFTFWFLRNFENSLGTNGLSDNLEFSKTSKNWSNLLIWVISDPKTSFLTKNIFSVWLFNPLGPRVA